MNETISRTQALTQALILGITAETEENFDVVEIFEGVRLIRVCVDEPTDDMEEKETQNGQ